MTSQSESRTVGNTTQSVTFSEINLNQIDIYVAAGQHIFVGNTDTGETVYSVSHAADTKTTIKASGVITASPGNDISFRTFATNLTPDATAYINNYWTTEVDLNGVLSSGRDYETGFTEGQTTGTEIAAASASLDNQSFKIKSLVVTLSNPEVGDSLYVNPTYTIGLLGRGISTAVTSHTHTIDGQTVSIADTVTLSAIDPTVGVSSADMQMALRATLFKNTSENPDVTPRVVNVVVTDVTNETGVNAHTTVYITPLNDAPILPGYFLNDMTEGAYTLTSSNRKGDYSATLNEGGVYALNSQSTHLDFVPLDTDNDPNTLTYTVKVLPGQNLTLFRDSNNDGQVDAGEALAVGSTFTQGEVSVGTIKVMQTGVDSVFNGFTQGEAQALMNSLTYENKLGTDGLASTLASSGMRTVTLASSSKWSDSGAVSAVTNGANNADITETASTTAVYSTATLADPGSNGYKSLTFKVANVIDGKSEVLHFGSVDVPLTVGSFVSNGVVFSVSKGTEPVNNASQTYFLVTVAKSSYAIGLELADGGQDGSLPVKTTLDLTLNPVNDAPIITATAATTPTFTEGGAAAALFTGVSISTNDTSGPAQTITEVTIQVSGLKDGSAEKLHLGNQAIDLSATSASDITVNTSYTVTRTVTVTNGVATVTLASSQTPAVWQSLLGSLKYSNTSSDPTGTSRTVTIVGVKDSGGTANTGVDTATVSIASTVALFAVNSAPVFASGAGYFEQTVLDGATKVISTAQLSATDADGSAATARLSYSLGTAPTMGKLFIDANGNGVADFGESIVIKGADASVDYTVGGQYRTSFTQADVVAGQLKYAANGTSIGDDPFTIVVSDGIAAPVSHVFTAHVVTASTVRGAVNTSTPVTPTDVFTSVAVAPLPSGQTIKSLTFTVSGVVDAGEKLTIGGTVVALLDGTSVTVGDVTYTVSVDAQGKATVVVTDNAAPGYSNTAAATLIDGITYSNTSSPATAGTRVIELVSTTNYIGSNGTLPETPINQGSVTATPTNPVTDIAAGTSVISSTDGSKPLFSSVDVNMPTGEVINTLTFAVDGVLDGNNEVLSISGTDVPLGGAYPKTVSGTNGATYTVSLGANGQVLVTASYTPPQHLTEVEMEAVLASVKYQDKQVPPTEGQRLVSLASMADSNTAGSTISVDLTGVVNVKPAVDPFGTTAHNALDVAVPAGSTVTSMTFTVDGVVDGANEVLKVNGQEIPLVTGTTTIGGVIYSVNVVDGKATVTMSLPAPGISEAQSQAVLDSVSYSDRAEPPTAAVKSIELTGVGVMTSPATTATNVTITGTATDTIVGPAFDPFSATAENTANAAINSGTTSLTFTVSGVHDGAKEVLNFGSDPVVSVPLTDGATVESGGVTYTVTVDGSGNAMVVASFAAGNGDLAESLVSTMSYQNSAAPITAGTRSINLTQVSDGTTPTNLNNVGDSVNPANMGELPQPKVVDPFGTLAANAVDAAVPTGSTVGGLTFTVDGVVDGANEVFTVNGQALPLVNGTTVTVGDVIYTVSVTGGTAIITVTKADPGFTEAQAQAVVDGATYVNKDGSPSDASKSISLTSLDVITGGTHITEPINDVNSNVIIGSGPVDPFSSTDLANANNAITGTTTSLTFTVSGVKDGANEVLNFGVAPNITSVPLVDGATVSAGGVNYTVSVDAGGNATVTASGLTSEGQAQSLVANMTYQNNDANPTTGERTISLSAVNATTVSGISGATQMGNGSTPNAAPAVTVNGFTMLEGGVVNVTKDILSVTDPDDALETLSFTLTGLTDATLFRDSNYNGVVNTGETIGLGQSFSYQDIVNGVLKIRHNGDQPASNVLSVSVSDGTTRVTGSHAFTVTNVNDAPTGLPSITGAAQRAGVLHAVTASIQDADLFTSNPPSFTYQWKADGADISGATGSSYTVARADIGKKITVLVGYNDAQGHAESVLSLPTGVVQNVNEAPTLTASAIAVAEGGSVTLTPSQIIAADGDGLGSNHVLTLGTVPVHGTLYLDQNGDANLDAGEELSINSQFAWNDLAAGKIRFKHDGSELSDSFQLKLSDSEAQTGLIDFGITRIPVNDAPVISGLSTVDGASVVNDLLTYATTGERKLLDQGTVYATVSDSDSADFSGGVLRVSIAQNRNAAKDALSIENITLGTSPNQHTVSLDGANVKYDTTVIGTVSGGTGANDLEVTFNASATAENVAAVIRAVAFTNLERVPASSSRMVTFELSDGDGGTSAPAQVSINLTASAAPIIQNNASEIYVQENNRDVGYFVALDPGNKALTYSISTATTSDNADRGKFVISAAGLLQFISAPDYEAPSDVGTDNTYQVIVKATNSDGLLDESILSVHVTNATTGPGEHEDTPPTLLVAMVNGAQMGLTFADANLLDGTNLPSTSQFAVTSNGQAVGVTGYLVNTATKVVTLTLARSIAYGETVLVSFTDPSAGNDVNTLQDIYGNDVASFTGQSALVLTPQPVAVSTGGGSGGAAPVAVIVPKTDTNVVTTPTVETAVKSIVYVAADGTKKVIEGDGNGDGIKDSLQNAVLSVPFKLSDKVSTADTTVAESFITLVTASVSGKVSANEVAAITEINQMDAPANLPPDVKMPLGLIGFKSTIPTIGANGSFSLYVDPTLPFNGYWKQNGQGVWTNLAASSFGGGMTSEDGKMRIDFVIQDGGEFDEDGVANGVIVDPGALGELPLSVMGTVATMPANVVWF